MPIALVKPKQFTSDLTLPSGWETNLLLANNLALNSCGMYFDTECTFWHEMHLKPRGIFSV
ncbi:3075_t:CDS:2 [Entrophospora sp. SA101]|nr:3075_t:CDS:2 [Entrophospora sp. SA101]